MAEESNEEQESFKIADRRKFNVDGSLREGVVIEERAAQTEPTFSTASTVSAPITSEAQPDGIPKISGADTADIFESGENEISAQDFQSDFAGNLANAETGADEDESLDESDIPGAENPASFANFLLSLASQAAAAMGLTENPMTGGRRADLETSRYWLEVLAMLREKTKGNLHSQEQKLFDGLLSDLRMQYVQLARAAEAQMKKQEEQLLKNAAQKFSGKDILGR